MTLLANVCRLILRITVPILLLASIGTAADKPLRVLLLDSFEKGFAPFEVFKATLRSELKNQSPEPLVFYELSVVGDRDEHSFLNYVLSTFKGQQLDLIVTLGGKAARFAQKNRDQLFVSTPLLFAALDERLLDNSVTPNSTTVAVRADFLRIIETLLQVLPKTKNIGVVVGTSAVEQFWREELGREFQRFENQLTFMWFDNLSFAEMLNRSATLPANSAILYVLLSIDAKGITRSEDSVLSEFHAKANAPIFGIQSELLGKGIVGGLIVNQGLSQKTAAIALRLLKKEAPESIKVPPQISGSAVFDWRELRRWNIDENRLPPDSIIRFRSLTAWDEYKSYAIVGGALFLFEFILVVGLAVNLLKRKRVERWLREAERQAQDFSKRLIQAQQAERSRLAELERRTLQLRRLASDLTLAEQHAREELAKTLHDGLQQLLFSGVMVLDRAVAGNSQADQVALLKKARANINEAIEAARTLSVNLFPPMLHIGGLPAALAWLAKRTQEQYGIVVKVTADPHANPVASDVRILLFEAVRELLFNAVKHAHVDRVDVNLALGPDDTILIDVSDEGIGFDPSVTLHHRDQHHVGLGLFSIEERIALFGGRLDVHSAPGKGARFSLALPRSDLMRVATGGTSNDAGWQERLVYDSADGTSRPLRILIADDHVVARAGLRELFSERPTLQVVGEAANGVEAISQAMALQPDVIVMDVSMPRIDGIEATRKIHDALPHIQIVGLSTHDDENSERSMREAGVEAYFTKNEGADRLLNYLLSVQTQAKGAAKS
jgi:signal transduction histidine kinase/CheY-like chemotaxis protein